MEERPSNARRLPQRVKPRLSGDSPSGGDETPRSSPRLFLLRRSSALISDHYVFDNYHITSSTRLVGGLSRLPVIEACRCSLPLINCSDILAIGTLFDRPQPGTRVGKKWEFFRLLLPSSCGQFCSRSESGPNPTNYWGNKVERRRIPHFRTEDLL